MRDYSQKCFINLLRGITVILVLVCGATVYGEERELRISVAASMTDLFKELTAAFMAEQPEVKVITNFGPSGGLAKQIDHGAPADLYVSANPKWMNFLLEKNKIDPETKKVFAHNKLVFVGIPGNGVTALEDLPKLERIGIGSPKSVPAGQYAQEALEKTGLWETLMQGGKLAMAKDVRQALIYADRSETGGSFVYRTDAMLAKKAEVLFEVPQDLYSKVTYPIGVTTMGKTKAEAKAFYDYVTSTAVHAQLTGYGFSLPE